MQRFKLTIEYDGRPFVGWQRQENGPSVQQTLEQAVFAVTQAETIVYGCGRTDAGVHAEGQVAHVDIAKALAAFRLQEALNAHLRPAPVAVVASFAIVVGPFAIVVNPITIVIGPLAIVVGPLARIAAVVSPFKIPVFHLFACLVKENLVIRCEQR